MVEESLHHERRNYEKDFLNKDNTASDPFLQFDIWYKEAANNGMFEANAMSVSTVSADGFPHSRIVLLKEYSHKGFVFFTNYKSTKGIDLEANPNIACLFFYENMERQIRIEGRVERLSDAENDLYFYSRPIESQYAAMASEQSNELESEDTLENRLKTLKAEHKKPQRPKHWGGYLIKPIHFEFWQGRPSRLHDRIAYQLNSNTNQWLKKRLAP